MAPRKTTRRRNKPENSTDRGNWFELVIFFLLAAAIYLLGTLLDSSWTGMRGRQIGAYFREVWGGAFLVPLLFLVYLCVAWFMKIRVPRPVGQILGTVQLYLTTAFALGLSQKADWQPQWILAAPGHVGSAVANFFMLNLGALGTILVAFASLFLAGMFYGLRLPSHLVSAFMNFFNRDKIVSQGHDSAPVRPPHPEGTLVWKYPGVSSVPYSSALLEEYATERHSAKGEKPPEGAVLAGPALSETPPSEPFREPDDTIEPQHEKILTPGSLTSPTLKSEKAAAAWTTTPSNGEGSRTAVEILEQLLASLEAGDYDLPASERKPWEEGEHEAPVVLESAAAPTPIESSRERRVLEVKDVVVAEDRLEGVKELLDEPIFEAATAAVGKGRLQDGRRTAVQEVFPDVVLPEEEEGVRVKAGVFPPPLDIFGPVPHDDERDDALELANTQAETIVNTLQNFGVKASVAHIVIGPSVVQFQIELAPGIKVSKVAGLANDLTMALAVVSVRVEAPILGQRYVGIEIPNPRRRGIALRSMMESDEFTGGDFLLPLPMGMRVDSRYLVCGLEDMPHLLVAGTTGSGKSVFVNSCILGMCSRRNPDELRLILVDPKHVEFAIYEGLPHLLARPISDPKKAIAALSWAVQEMERRTECFARTRVRNLASYNEKVLPKDRFPNIVVVVDELADLMYTAGKEVESLIARLAQKARAAGIHLILATQRPSVDVITGLIKANVPARVAFAVPSQTDSRTIIDTGGAEKLLGKGDMLFYSTRYPRPLRLQASFITEERTLDFVEYTKKLFGEPDYLEFEDVVIGADTGRNGSSGGVLDDPKMEEALRVVMDTGIASASGLQRYLNIGYPRAGRLVTGLEQLGVLGPQPPNSSKPREILMDEESAFEALERARGNGLYDE